MLNEIPFGEKEQSNIHLIKMVSLQHFDEKIIEKIMKAHSLCLDSETPADEEATDQGFTKATELRQEDLEEEEEEEKVCRRRTALREEREPRELEMGKLGHVEKSSCNDPRACVSVGLCFIFSLGSSLIISDVAPSCAPARQQKTRSISTSSSSTALASGSKRPTSCFHSERLILLPDGVQLVDAETHRQAAWQSGRVGRVGRAGQQQQQMCFEGTQAAVNPRLVSRC